MEKKGEIKFLFTTDAQILRGLKRGLKMIKPPPTYRFIDTGSAGGGYI
jgi:hypothetical protein